jgi:adenylate kinase family enzyme
MQRITIIGCGGSGKSTLASNLGHLLGIPVHHLDRLYWKPGWAETPKPEWASIQERLCDQRTWIMDGNYEGTMGIRLLASDTVIFLDMPTRICLWGAIQRFLKYRGGIRPDVSAGCPERLSLVYLLWIWTYRRKRRPRILYMLRQLSPEKYVVILKSRRSVKDFLGGPHEKPANFIGKPELC